MACSNPLETLYRQYVASPNLRNIVYLLYDSINACSFIDDFYTNIWDIETADSYGLDIWGKILNLSRVMPYQSTELWFGFSEALLDYATQSDPMPWDNYSFYTQGAGTGGSVVLSDDNYRKALMMKAMANITPGTIPSMNQMLMYLFGDSGNAWVTNDGAMSMSYHFDFEPDDVELALIQNSDILPVPAGCSVSYILEG